MTKRPSKRLYSSINQDRITNLPECLVSEIMSRLPTKDAVRTSILSKAWHNKWTSLYKVSLTHESWKHPHTKESFKNAINIILHYSYNLQCFQFTSQNFFDKFCYQKWIPIILKNKLECLEIDVNLCGIVYPSCLFNHTSLKKLHLQHFRSTICVGVRNFAPNLTTIYLYYIEIVNNEPKSSTMNFDFPVLENFSYHNVKWVNVTSVEINAPLLTKLSYTNTCAGDLDYSISIVSPRMTRFVCEGLPEISLIGGSSVVSAVVNCFSDIPGQDELIGSRVKSLVNVFTGLEELVLSLLAAEALLSGSHLRSLGKVTRISLHIDGSAQKLLAFLHAMPSLKFLALRAFKWKNYNYDAIELVPSCISQLEEVVLLPFTCKVSQDRLVKFLFKNAHRLKKFTAFISDLNVEPSMVSRHLSTFERHSPVLKIGARPKPAFGEFGSFSYE